MPIDWKSAYAAALREQDSAKLPQLCEHARRIINKRFLQQGTECPAPREKEELNEALRQLFEHELEQSHLPSPQIH
jgi:hypothetical protein